MEYAERIARTHPMVAMIPDEIMQATRALSDCAATCHLCADACLHEEMVKDLVQCIEKNLDCADACDTSAHLLHRPGSMNTGAWESQLRSSCEALKECAIECDRHASMHEHCRVCAEACRATEQTCTKALHLIPQMAGAYSM